MDYYHYLLAGDGILVEEFVYGEDHVTVGLGGAMWAGGDGRWRAAGSFGRFFRTEEALLATVTPVGTTMRIAGRIWQISPIIDPASRQGTVRIELPFNSALRPGGFAAAEIGGGVGNVPLLPESAVLSDQKGNYVYLIDPDNHVVRRDVKVGDVDDRGVTILSGLSGTERVVASAGAFLNPGDKVKPQLSASPR